MKVNRQAPPGLIRMQAEFGSAIRTPFSFTTGRFQCRKEAYPKGIAESITPQTTRDGRARLAVYNEQYWYRLLTVLQKDFPLLSATLGLWNFNQLATAYLDRHPSHSPFLHDLPKRFADFLETHPLGAEPRHRQIAGLEAAILNAFHAPSIPSLDPGALSPRELEILPHVPLAFQPWLSLVEEDGNLMENHLALKEDPDQVPVLREGKGRWAIYRTGSGVEWEAMDALPFELLNRLRRGQPLAAACEAMDAGLEPSEREDFANGLSSWFERWGHLTWFGRPSFEGLVNR